MNEILYCVEDERGNVIAKDLNMDNAMIFVRALFNAYYNEDELFIAIKRQKEKCELLGIIQKKDELIKKLKCCCNCKHYNVGDTTCLKGKPHNSGGCVKDWELAE